MPPPKSYITHLEQIGFSNNEASVYVALLELGSTTTGPLAKKTGLHSQLIYKALDGLLRRNLASFVIKRNRKYFQASNPEMLLDTLHHLEDATRAYIPDLKRLQKSGKDPLQVKILYGHEGFISNLRDVVTSASKHDKVVRIIGGAAGHDFYRVIGDWYDTYVELLARKKVAKWQISPTNAASEFKEKFAREPNTVLKIMPRDFSSITQTRITPELATIEIYETETIIIQIWNKAIAQSYRTYFDFLWKQGKPYTPNKVI